MFRDTVGAALNYGLWIACSGLLLAALNIDAAFAGPRVGSCWADEPNSTVDYDCEGFDSVTHSGVAVVPLGIGFYEVVFPRLYSEGPPSDVQVSTELISGYCTTSGWTNGRHHSIGVFVNCYDANGDSQNNYFSVLYQSRTQLFGSSSKGMVFLWADQPNNPNYIPNPAYQYNSTGATNSMVRNGTGSYTATLPGLTMMGGDVQVTAYGSVPARCLTSGWTSDDTGTSVNVLCFDSTGVPADEMFTLLYTLKVAPSPLKGLQGAYAWADRPDDTNVYTPASAYNYNGFGGGKLTAQKTGTGQYSVNVPGGQNSVAGLVLASSHGTSATYCSGGDGFIGWLPIQISCYDQGGDPVDSEFDVTFLQ